ncbi:TetR/AcrR family transcriptional regulator [Nonomuraea sp. NBC_00507]|uniref:TetR/AcrR family transcriptional regulator n=1 Tax=Nonomuraea sp. NBC_00507 TaxID=2976002 RepID=UPI002E1992CC
MDRRTELTAKALDHVLTHGLIGLSLRPLAAALGTSDRMLIYHFGSKDGLITAVLALANQRFAASFQSMAKGAPPARSPDEFVRYAWRVLAGSAATGAIRLYLEMCVLTLREPERWSTAQQQIREPWLAMLRETLTDLNTPQAQVPALADLILDTLDGLLLDRLISTDPARADDAADAFADLLRGFRNGDVGYWSPLNASGDQALRPCSGR